MRRPTRTDRHLAGAACLAVILTACAGDPAVTTAEDSGAPSSPAPTSSSGSPTPSPAASPTPATTLSTSPATRTPSARPAPAPGTRIKAGPSPYGDVLFDATGQAVYVFDVERDTEPRCYGACADAWPPVLTDGRPQAGAGGVRDRLLGTTKRTDGSTQVTYAGQPLYFYAHEGKDEVRCHDIVLNGGTWYAVQPDGRWAP